MTLREAQENVKFLGTQVESWLAVFFNVYGSVARNSRTMVGDVINSWMSIANEKVDSLEPKFEPNITFTLQESRSAFQKVLGLFRTNLPEAQSNPNSTTDLGNMATTAQDILILLLPNLPAPDLRTLFDLSLTSDVLTSKDNGVQKRGYKTLTKVIESGKVEVDVESTLKKLDELVDGLSVAAKKVCGLSFLENHSKTRPRIASTCWLPWSPSCIRLLCILSHLFFQKLHWARKSRRKKQEPQHLT